MQPLGIYFIFHYVVFMTLSRKNCHRRFCYFTVDYDVRRYLAFLRLNLNHFYTCTKSFAMLNAVIAQFAIYCQIKWPFSDITSSGLSTGHLHPCATHHAGFKASWKWSSSFFFRHWLQCEWLPVHQSRMWHHVTSTYSGAPLDMVHTDDLICWNNEGPWKCL